MDEAPYIGVKGREALVSASPLAIFSSLNDIFRHPFAFFMLRHEEQDGSRNGCCCPAQRFPTVIAGLLPDSGEFQLGSCPPTSLEKLLPFLR